MTIKSSKTLVDEALKEVKSLELNEVKELIDNKSCTMVDVRDIREIYNEGGIANALHIPRGMLEFWVDPQSQFYQHDKVSDDKKIVLFCDLGARSALATKSLKDMGFKKVAHVKGGYRAMAASGIFQLMQLKKEKNTKTDCSIGCT